MKQITKIRNNCYGRLGKIVAKYGKCFGMNVLAYDINPDQYDLNNSSKLIQINKRNINSCKIKSNII